MVASIGLSFVLTLSGLEIILRCMPVSEALRGEPVNDAHPIYRFTPNRSVQWSKGWNFSLRNEIWINNYGFISDIDYDPTATSLLLAIIGDSFVEAAMVPYGQTAAGLLKSRVADTGRVYSFGASGAALSQYLAYAKYVGEEFQPAGLVIVIAGNDFDESLMKYRSYPGFHYFVDSTEHGLRLQRLDRSIPRWKDWVVSSAMGRYVVLNLEAGNVMERLTHRMAALFGKRRFVGNVDAEVERGRLEDSRLAVDAFLTQLPLMSRLTPDRILLVLDAPRPEIYSPDDLHAAQKSFFGQIRRYLMAQAAIKGFELIDLENVFVLDYQERGMKFEHRHDYHWNTNGHEVMAGAIRRSSVFQQMFVSTAGQSRDSMTTVR
ncbi:MAG: hypothetical protein H0V35_14180 [Nitrospira sp.]|nr:hypothetical protein [Nitrospira sp.]